MQTPLVPNPQGVQVLALYLVNPAQQSVEVIVDSQMTAGQAIAASAGELED
jgi:hypothetical protein